MRLAPSTGFTRGGNSDGSPSENLRESTGKALGERVATAGSLLTGCPGRTQKKGRLLIFGALR